MQQTAHDYTPLKTEGFAHPPRNVAALQVEPGMTVADFGAGSGAYVLEIARALEGHGRVYAIDVQRDLLRRIKNEAHKRGLKNVDIIWGDLEAPGGSKLGDHSLDLVLISNLLFQVERKEGIFEEAHRILRDHGRLAIIDWQGSYGGMGPQKKDVVEKNYCVALAEGSGFGLHAEFKAGAHHYGLMFTKK